MKKQTLMSPHRKRELQKVLAWAKAMVDAPDQVVYWDCETTSFEGYMVQLAALDGNGKTFGAMRLNPGEPISPKATAVHGITDNMVADAPSFADVYDGIYRKFHQRHWVIYNAPFDTEVLYRECRRLGRPAPKPLEIHCAMRHYAVVHGSWNNYHRSYTWQKLEVACKTLRVTVAGSAHDALTDVRMTLGLVQAIAKSELS